jgi:hypothetical protein
MKYKKQAASAIIPVQCPCYDTVLSFTALSEIIFSSKWRITVSEEDFT